VYSHVLLKSHRVSEHTQNLRTVLSNRHNSYKIKILKRHPQILHYTLCEKQTTLALTSLAVFSCSLLRGICVCKAVTIKKQQIKNSEGYAQILFTHILKEDKTILFENIRRHEVKRQTHEQTHYSSTFYVCFAHKRTKQNKRTHTHTHTPFASHTSQLSRIASQLDKTRNWLV